MMTITEQTNNFRHRKFDLGDGWYRGAVTFRVNGSQYYAFSDYHETDCSHEDIEEHLTKVANKTINA